MPEFRNKVFEGIILDKDCFEITIQQALAKIRRLRKARAKDQSCSRLTVEAGERRFKSLRARHQNAAFSKSSPVRSNLFTSLGSSQIHCEVFPLAEGL